MIILTGFSIVFLTAIGQILLKKGANKRDGNLLLNGFVISGYVTFLLTVVLSYYLMKVIPMKYFTVIMSASYVVVMVGARLYLNETITRDRLLGTALIASGILVFLLK